MQFTHILAEVLQRSDSPRAFLYLIEKHTGLSGNNLCPAIHLKLSDNPSDIEVIIEYGRKLFGFLKIDADIALEVLSGELLYDIGLSALSDTCHKQRLSARLVFPLFQVLKNFPVHTPLRSALQGNYTKSPMTFANKTTKVL